MLSEQLSFNFVGESNFPNSKAVSSAVEKLSMDASAKSRGAIFTRQEVVDFILDLLGYTSDQALYTKQLLEPAFGAGDFLLPIVKRLLASWRAAHTKHPTVDDLSQAIRAVELHRPTYNRTHEALIFLLTAEGLTPSAATTLANQWLLQGDFLLIPLTETFDFVVGNPPYIRQELIPEPLLAEYRNRYNTLYDRADIYVPFIERSLYLLAPQGNVGFICANRWTKNRYGGPLRALIAQDFHLKIYVDMENSPAFTSKVVAYPSITIISQGKSDITRVSPPPPSIDPTTLKNLSTTLLAKALPQSSKDVRELSQVTSGSDPWLLEPSEQTALIRRLEQQFPGLEAAGCKVGIGVATGADKVFIADFESLDVESQCKLPLATTKDIVNGDVQWLGKGVINPFDSTGSLVDLEQYPRLQAYLEQYRDVIANRHCAKKSPNNWYRTIDRITPALAARPKLLIPDIKGDAHIVFEPGDLYPHHNLYYVLSDEWELRALQAVLLSAMTHLFIATYSTKMRGGFLRFQAQYLRRIHIPCWRDVPPHLRQELANAAIRRDLDACDHAVAELYGLSDLEQTVLQGVRA